MLPLAYYLLKVIICSGILYGYYWLLLRNKVFHKYNRFYLMASVVLSLLVPLIKISFWQQNASAQSSVIKVLQVVSNGDEYMDTVVISSQNNAFDTTQLYPFAYLLVSLILLIVFLHTLYVIATLLKKYPRQTIESISFINTDAKSTPFSFLKYIFWNHNIDMETTTGNQIFKHELAHVQEGHTYDKLFINLVLIFFWCNPFYWLYRKELNMIHEFIADKKAVEDSDTAAFAAMILQATYPQHRFQLTNNFFYSPVKRRLLMLTKSKNPKVNYFGRVMVLPLLILVFAAFTFKTKSAPEAASYNGKKIVVVIDPGHGGKDGGAKSKDGILEKELTLAIAKEIKALNTNDAIDIILTKETDTYFTKEQKNAFATAHNAAIYISIHIGLTATAEEKEYHLGDPMDDASGLKIIIGDDSAATYLQSKLLGSVIADEFSSNYPLPVSHQLVQRRLYTMENNHCPSVYLEAGLMNNKKDLAFMVSKEGKQTIAKNILAAINKFASANLQNSVSYNNPIDTSKNHPVYFNGSHADSNYLKTNDYKLNALVIIDSKDVGNVGMNYIEENNIKFNSIVCYNPVEAKKKYGPKGKYGVIKITQKDLVLIHATSVTVNEKNNIISVPGSNTTIDGNLSNTVIYIDGKVSTPAQLNAISPDKINSIDIFKSQKLDEIVEAKGKTSVINVTLKPEPLTEVVVKTSVKPLYVLNSVVQEKEFNLNTIAPNDIESINVLKDQVATIKYGDKGKNGVVEITLKKQPQNMQEVVAEPKQKRPLYVINNKIEDDDARLKSLNPDAIESINVLKDTAAMNKYGAKGKNGVIEIVTKKNITLTLQKPPLSAINIQVSNNDKIFTKVETASYYAKGNDAWKKYLQKNLDPAIPVAEGWKAGSYTIIVQFIIHTDGTVSDVTTINYQGTKTAQHCIDLVKKSGKWIPAVQNGQIVNAYRKQPITFLITNEDVKNPITEIYSVPLKVHLFKDGKANTYDMVGNGTFSTTTNQLYLVNGKIINNPAAVKKANVSSMESYDAGSGKLYFGEKGKYGVTMITSKFRVCKP